MKNLKFHSENQYLTLGELENYPDGMYEVGVPPIKTVVLDMDVAVFLEVQKQDGELGFRLCPYIAYCEEYPEGLLGAMDVELKKIWKKVAKGLGIKNAKISLIHND